MTNDDDFASYASARWHALVRSAVGLGCDVEEAHDLVQVTLMRAYQKWAQVQKADNRDGYVYRMLVNARRDSRRRRWWGERPSAMVDEQQSVQDRTNEVAAADAVHRALGDLSQDAREVVVLRYFAHLTDHQAADVLGIPVGTVKSRLSRALVQLSSNSHLTDLTNHAAPTSLREGSSS
ncbi:sigma-70 family RNA polymerase sigma factor [Nocardioides pacificus]